MTTLSKAHKKTPNLNYSAAASQSSNFFGGPGYRVYYCQAGSQFYWVFVGGTKKTQTIDVGSGRTMRFFNYLSG
jgi:hypothetical protein